MAVGSCAILMLTLLVLIVGSVIEGIRLPYVHQSRPTTENGSGGLRDGNAKVGQFCIDQKLAEGLAGDVRKGLFFRGASPLPFGSDIRPVRDLVAYLLTGARPHTPTVAHELPA